jgi:hypothetical protein
VDHGLCWKCLSYSHLWILGKRYRVFPRFENGWIQTLEGASMELGARLRLPAYPLLVNPVRLCISMRTAGLFCSGEKNVRMFRRRLQQPSPKPVTDTYSVALRRCVLCMGWYIM